MTIAGIRVEQQGEHGRVHPLEREEEQPGLRRVADRAHQGARPRTAPRLRPGTHPCHSGNDGQHRRRQPEADEQQRADADVGVVRELAEDGHDAERGGGEEAECGTHGRGMAMPRPLTRHVQRRFLMLVVQLS